MELAQKVEDTGDPGAAKELNDLSLQSGGIEGAPPLACRNSQPTTPAPPMGTTGSVMETAGLPAEAKTLPESGKTLPTATPESGKPGPAPKGTPPESTIPPAPDGDHPGGG